jgi:hypothetical protein
VGYTESSKIPVKSAVLNDAHHGAHQIEPAQGAATCGDDPRLGALLSAWPTLPEPIRVAIAAMVGSVKG